MGWIADVFQKTIEENSTSKKEKMKKITTASKDVEDAFHIIDKMIDNFSDMGDFINIPIIWHIKSADIDDFEWKAYDMKLSSYTLFNIPVDEPIILMKLTEKIINDIQNEIQVILLLPEELSEDTTCFKLMNMIRKELHQSVNQSCDFHIYDAY